MIRVFASLVVFIANFLILQSEKEDRQSDPSLEEKLHQAAKELTEEKRKSARRKE